MKVTPLDEWICRKISVPSGGLSKNVLKEFQLEKLNTTLRHVRKNSRFYQRHLEGMPETINSMEDLGDFPFLTSSDLQAHSSEMVCVPMGEISRIVTMNTSGTTGIPKRIYFTPDDQELTIDFFGIGMSTFVDESDRVLILLPDTTPGSVGDLLFTGLSRIGVKPVRHGPIVNLQETLSIISEMRITSLVGAPTQLLALCRFCEINQGNNPIELKSILLSTDHVPESLARTLEESWKCRVYNHYGMTEMGLGGGVFCDADFGYHLREADMIFEIIDPTTGEKQPDGVLGELVFSTLTRKGMPLIRYRTGDLARFLSSPCPCSSTLRSLDKVTNRIDQSFLIGSEEFHLSEMDEVLFSCPDLINFQIRIDHDQIKDTIFFQLYSLRPLTEISHYYDAISSYLDKKQVNPDSYNIIVKTLTGFPSELASLQKRKVIENDLKQFAKNY
ncbi:MAG: phenylacetate--CoA ligase [Leptolinea sp.]|nr:phenylacetate--CoA ligase [Leptolinea sp.]